MVYFDDLSAKIKKFSDKYEEVYIYTNEVIRSKVHNLLISNGIKIAGYIHKGDEGYKDIFAKYTEGNPAFVGKCGVVVVGEYDEINEIKRDNLSQNFIYIKPQAVEEALRNYKTSDGKIHLCDWSRIYDIDNNWWIRFIRCHFPNLDDDIFFYSVHGVNYFVREPRDGIKIFYTAEVLNDIENYYRNPTKSPFNHCLEYVDLSLAFEYIDAMNYMRFPYWITTLFKPEATLDEIKKTINTINSSHYRITDYCACICSHDNWKTRTMVYNNVKDLFDVKFAGRWNNNTDELHKDYNNDKIEYLKHFCFNICAENMNSPGYCTEKIFDSFKADAIPLYYGDGNHPCPDVINQNAVICFDPNSNNEESRNLIKGLISNKKMYCEYISQEKIKSSSAEYIYERYFNGLYKRLEYLINRRKKEKSLVNYLGCKPLEPFVYERLDKISDYKIRRRDDTQHNLYKYDKIFPNRRYNVHLSNIEADFDEFTMGLYDFKNECVVKYEIFPTLGEINFNFDTKQNVDGLALCIYAGINGETRGKTMTIGNMEVIAASLC